MQNFITQKDKFPAFNKPRLIFKFAEYNVKRELFYLFCIFFSLAAGGASPCLFAQKLAFLTPDNSSSSQKTRTGLEKILSENFKVLDDSITETVPRISADQNLFNLSTEEAQNFGRAAGCNFFVLVKSETLRRATLSKPYFYIESNAIVYLVSARSGNLVLWKLARFESPTAAESEEKLASSIKNIASEISAGIKSEIIRETDDEPQSKIEELPDENSAAAKNFRPPLPYRRIKPVYTTTANLYNITATVDAAVDLDEKGDVTQVEIKRWAGYGLDQSVAETIRKMQWRAATRDGKSLPIRVLLRYNFKKIEPDE